MVYKHLSGMKKDLTNSFIVKKVDFIDTFDEEARLREIRVSNDLSPFVPYLIDKTKRRR